MMANICQGSHLSTSLQNKVQFKKDLGLRNCQSVLHGIKGFNFLQRMLLLWKIKCACLYTQKKSTSLEIVIMTFIKQFTVYSKLLIPWEILCRNHIQVDFKDKIRVELNSHRAEQLQLLSLGLSHSQPHLITSLDILVKWIYFLLYIPLYIKW